MRRWWEIILKVCVSRKHRGKTKKNLFQGKSARSKHWFILDIEWVEENFSTIEPQFYKRLFQTNIEGQAVLIYPIFPVIFGNTNLTGKSEYDIQAQLVAYYHNAVNSCCFSSFASAFTASGEKNYERSIPFWIE